MPGGPKLAELAFQQIYHRKVRHDVAADMVVKDEYKGWVDNAPYVIDYLANISPSRAHHSNTPLMLQYD
jgi:hypothetical protein